MNILNRSEVLNPLNSLKKTIAKLLTPPIKELTLRGYCSKYGNTSQEVSFPTVSFDPRTDTRHCLCGLSGNCIKESDVVSNAKTPKY